MSRADCLRAMLARAQTTPGSRLDLNAFTVDGSNANILVNALAAGVDENDARSSARIAANLSATAREVDLDTYFTEKSWGKLARKAAAASQISVWASRPAPASGDGVIAAGEEILVGALTFTVDAPVYFLAGSTGKQLVSATCTKLGSSTNVAISGAKFKAPSGLFDPLLALSTTDDHGVVLPGYDWATGGADKERDSDYRARCAQWDAGLDRNVDVILAGAKAIDGIAFAALIEDLSYDGYPTGGLTLYIGDINGRANAALVARLRAGLRRIRLAGQHVKIVGSVPSLQKIVLSFGVLDGFTVADVQAQAAAAVIAAVNALQPGATLSRATIAAACSSVKGLVLLSSTPFGCTIPAADVIPASIATKFRTSVDLVSFA